MYLRQQHILYVLAMYLSGTFDQMLNLHSWVTPANQS